MRPRKFGQVYLVSDPTLSHGRSGILSRAIGALKQHATIHILPGETTEIELLKKLEDAPPPQAILVPWKKYFEWSRIESFFGRNRNSGPAFAGYHCEPLRPSELKMADHPRCILLDFANRSPAEIAILFRSLVEDTLRSGLKPLLHPNTYIHSESWYGAQGLGNRIDAILTMLAAGANNSEMNWGVRAPSIRIALCAFWGLVYEDGPGKRDFHKAASNKTPKAYFQIGSDRHCLVMRLCTSMPGWSSKDALETFWPGLGNPLSSPQLLAQYADFVRVHPIAENSDIEIVAGFFSSVPSPSSFHQVKEIWIEPLSSTLILESPAESCSVSDLKTRAEAQVGDTLLKAKERFIAEASVKIRELTRTLKEREETIQELRSGGVGTAPAMPVPEAENLLEAFKERWAEAHLQIQEYQLQIEELIQKGGPPKAIDGLKRGIQRLTLREKAWMKMLVETLDHFRKRGGNREGA